jgi:hypothetical protein
MPVIAFISIQLSISWKITQPIARQSSPVSTTVPEQLLEVRGLVMSQKENHVLRRPVLVFLSSANMFRTNLGT